MKKIMINIFEQYAILDAEAKALDAKKADLRAHILRALIENNHEPVETPFGKFTYSPTTKYVYPDTLVEMEEELKALQVKAKNTGEAVETKTDSFRFVSTKI